MLSFGITSERTALSLEDAMLNKPSNRHPLGNIPLEDLDIIADLDGSLRSYRSGADLAEEGRAHYSAFILREGWTITYKIMRGGDRQILDLNIPGDLLGLRQILFEYSEHRIEALTDVVAWKIPGKSIIRSFGTSPLLASWVLRAASSDSAAASERLVSLGRRDACQRTVHFLLELGARLKRVGLASNAGFECPLSQTELADVLGLSAVHVNRVLRKLREDGLLTFHGGNVRFIEFAGLVELAEFDTTYVDYRSAVVPARQRM